MKYKSTKKRLQNTLPEGGVQNLAHHAFVLTKLKPAKLHKEVDSITVLKCHITGNGLKISTGRLFTITTPASLRFLI